MMAKLTYSDTLEDIVGAANVAGYMEKENRIYIDTDTELTDFLIEIHNLWDSVGGDDVSDESFLSYAAEELLKKFGCQDD